MGVEAGRVNGVVRQDLGFNPSQYDYATQYSLKGAALSPVAGRAFDAFASLPVGSWVLDLGGGDGRLPDNAPKPRGFRFLAVELSPEAVARYQDTVARDGRLDEAVVGDITRLASLPQVQEREIGGAISWRVIHALNRAQQLQTLDQLRQLLPANAPVFLAVYSDLDWKAAELKAQGRYNPDDANNCADIMRLRQAEFNLCFFNPRQVVELANQTGFVTQAITPFEEPTGYSHLTQDHPNNRYLLACLKRIP